ncbi:MAG: 50S ribosomal protein L35 [Gemmatimonadetes bacterium]|nr:MAG: 50S ribosomal protein L35 [Gemmatimonadota bacterium]
MPKIKTRRGVAKRFKKLPGGRIKRRRSNAGHIMSKKSRKRKRVLRQGTYISEVDQPRVERMMPY